MIRPGCRPATRAATRSRVTLVAVAVATTVALAGCAAGQIAQTANQANSATGATVTVNGIAIRDAQITFPEAPAGAESAAVYRAGGSAPVEMYVINQSTESDRLVSASSPVAGSVTVEGETDLPAGTMMVVGERVRDGRAVGAGLDRGVRAPADRVARSELVGRAHELGRRAGRHLAHRVGLGER